MKNVKIVYLEKYEKFKSKRGGVSKVEVDREKREENCLDFHLQNMGDEGGIVENSRKYKLYKSKQAQISSVKIFII